MCNELCIALLLFLYFKCICFYFNKLFLSKKLPFHSLCLRHILLALLASCEPFYKFASTVCPMLRVNGVVTWRPALVICCQVLYQQEVFDHHQFKSFAVDVSDPYEFYTDPDSSQNESSVFRYPAWNLVLFLKIYLPIDLSSFDVCNNFYGLLSSWIRILLTNTDPKHTVCYGFSRDCFESRNKKVVQKTKWHCPGHV